MARIADWETVCNHCWKLIGEFDMMRGTHYQDMIREGKFILIQNIKLETIGTFYPLSHEERLKKARAVGRIFCTNCQMRVEQTCEKCIWHKLMNSIIGVDPW
jgi:hypothetical protein